MFFPGLHLCSPVCVVRWMGQGRMKGKDHRLRKAVFRSGFWLEEVQQNELIYLPYSLATLRSERSASRAGLCGSVGYARLRCLRTPRQINPATITQTSACHIKAALFRTPTCPLLVYGCCGTFHTKQIGADQPPH